MIISDSKHSAAERTVSRRNVCLRFAVTALLLTISLATLPLPMAAAKNTKGLSKKDRYYAAQAAATRFATLNGHRIHYVSHGEGKEALVFVHGGVGSLNNWKLQTPAFAGKKRLILLDLLGHGIPMEMPQEFNHTLQTFLVKIGFPDDKKSARKEIPTGYVEAFIGEWEAPPEVKEKRPELKGKIQKIFAWGSHQRPVRILEGCPYNQKDNCMLEGFSFWNPVTGRVEYHAYNNEADLLYKGEYTLLEKDKLQMAFEVHYPTDHDFAKRGHPVILFKVAYALRNADTLDINIMYFNKKDNRWDPWGGDDDKGNYVAIRRKTQ